MTLTERDKLFLDLISSGVNTREALIAETGLRASQVKWTLAKLREQGLITWDVDKRSWVVAQPIQPTDQPTAQPTQLGVETAIDIAPNGVRVITPDISNFILKKVPAYVSWQNEFEVYQSHLEVGNPLLLMGPKGIGKTLSVARFAFERGIPLIQIDCSERTTKYDLVGRFVIIGDEVVYVLGVMPLAITIANKHGSVVLVFEELPALTPKMQKVLNQLLDWRKHVFVPDLNITYNLEEGSRLMIAATGNPPESYGGLYEINEDLMDRFSVWWWNYPPEHTEKEIIRAVVGPFDDKEEEMLDNFIKLANDLRNASEVEKLSYVPSPRAGVQFMKLFRSYNKIMGEKKALRFALCTAIVGKAQDKGTRDTIRARISSVFGVRV